MSGIGSYLKGSIGLSGAIRFLMAVLGVIVIAAAFAAGRLALAIVGVLFVMVAIALGYWGRLARRG